MLVRESGPFEILDKFRYWIGIRWGENNQKYGKNVIAKLFLCVWCLSIWVAFAVAWMSGYSVNIHTYVIVSLAISAVAILMDEAVK